MIERKAPSQREHVVLTPEAEWTETSSDVLTGHERVAAAIVEAWLADNPREVLTELTRWIAENQEAAFADVNWSKRWAAELVAAPGISDALKHGSEELFERAELTKLQRLAMRSIASGKTPTQIAVAVGITASAVRSRIDEARTKILNLGPVGE